MPGGLQSGELGRSTGILPVFHGQDGRATRDFAVLLALLPSDRPFSTGGAIASRIARRRPLTTPKNHHAANSGRLISEEPWPFFVGNRGWARISKYLSAARRERRPRLVGGATMNAILNEPIPRFPSSIVARQLALASYADRLCRQLSRSSPDQAAISTDSFSKQLSPTANSGSSIGTKSPASLVGLRRDVRLQA